MIEFIELIECIEIGALITMIIAIICIYVNETKMCFYYINIRGTI